MRTARYLGIWEAKEQIIKGCLLVANSIVTSLHVCMSILLIFIILQC